jgi:hypothetical protein
MDLATADSAVGYAKLARLSKAILLLASVLFSIAVFLTLDWFRSAAIMRSAKSTVKPCNCTVADPVRYHALKPDCSCTVHWGKDWVDLHTNSLGFRDEKVRDVPLTDARPRILVLGNSFTESMTAWRDSYVGMIAARLPEYEFLNGGVASYSTSNYLNVERMVAAKGIDIDEVIVFAGVTEVHDEAAVFRDVDDAGAVTMNQLRTDDRIMPWSWKKHLAMHFALTYAMLEFFERFLIRHGYYVTVTHPELPAFDLEATAWTYRKVNEADPYHDTFHGGYAPLGVEGGIAKAEAKMTLLWQELEKRNIPISVVVYPYPAQLLHDTADSRQVRVWREWCEGKCKRFISLFPVFFAAKDQCPRPQPGCWYERYFIFGDIHYNASGNAVVADAVIKSLTESPPAKHQPQFSGRASQQKKDPAGRGSM